MPFWMEVTSWVVLVLGGIVAATLGTLKLWDRFHSAYKRRRDDKDYDINQSFH